MAREGFATNHLALARVDRGRLQIGSSVLAVIRHYAQDTPEKTEAGGILLGRRILGTDDIIVDDVSTPMPGDQRSRFQFFRAQRRHQEVINRACRDSNGTCTYLGEWHTHPESRPIPSFIDRLHWQQKLFIDQFGEPIFFVIVGISEVRVWEGYYNHHLIPLQ